MKTRTQIEKFQTEQLDVLLATIDEIEDLPTSLYEIIEQRIAWDQQGLCDVCGGRIQERTASMPLFCSGTFNESSCVQCGEFYGNS